MFIGIDGNEANVTNRVGSNVYAYQILKYFYSLLDSRSDLKFRIYLKSETVDDMPISKGNWEYHIFGPKPFWTQIALPNKLYFEKLGKNSPDIFFTPGHYAPRLCPIPNTISIMDLAFLNFPLEFLKKDLEKLKNWTKYSITKADHIFTISNFTKQDIIKRYSIKEEKITVTYPGDGTQKPKKPQDKSFQYLSIYFDLKKPYVLYIATLQPRKNHKTLIDAFSKIKKQGKFQDLKLVLTGKKGWLYEDLFTQVKNLNLEEDVIFTGFVSEWEKQELLRYANVFVMPSLYEGFGIPILEAMNSGVPVLASKVSSIPEIGDDTISYIENPKDSNEIEKKLINLLQLEELERNNLINSQKKQAAKFNWQNCGSLTLEKLLTL